MKKIITNLWFDSQAEEAAGFYASIFGNSRIGNVTRYGKAGFEIHGQPEGKAMTVEFELEGQAFTALNGGPLFKFTPSVSFLIACKTKEEVDALWEKLSVKGKPLMELGTYPFSERYGWLEDRFGLSWQVMHMGDRKISQIITPTLMYTGMQSGKAEEAVRFYASIFADSKIDDITRYEKGEEPDPAGTVKHASFTLAGQGFAAMDSAHKHDFTFTEAISFIVNCRDQKEVDYYWEKFTQDGDPAAQQCGWLKDRYGLSWQIVPEELGKMMSDPDPKKTERLMESFLKMKKIDIAELKKAFVGKT